MDDSPHLQSAGSFLLGDGLLLDRNVHEKMFSFVFHFWFRIEARLRDTEEQL